MTGNTVRTIQLNRRMRYWLSVTGSLRHAIQFRWREEQRKQAAKRRAKHVRGS